MRKLNHSCSTLTQVLETEIQTLKGRDSDRLRGEYDRLVAGLREAQQRRENEVILANPVLPGKCLCQETRIPTFIETITAVEDPRSIIACSPVI